ncbi:MAG: PorT family protein [Candidatus Symbiothrix sp.]|nr:PorT family protein [Candidatus Symbiothrix sp.]
MNKKRFMGVLYFLTVCIVAFSQNNSFTPEWAVGINGGATFSKVSFSTGFRIPQELLLQSSEGITIRYISENNFGIQGELNYSLRGWKEITDSVHLNRQTRSLAYLELPLMTHIYFGMGKRANFIFNLGPQVSYFLHEKNLETEINTANVSSEYYNVKIQHKFDYGLKATMGIEFKTGVGSFVLDGRYYFGLSDIFNNSKSDLFQASPHKVIGLNLTYLYRIKQ